MLELGGNGCCCCCSFVRRTEMRKTRMFVGWLPVAQYLAPTLLYVGTGCGDVGTDSPRKVDPPSSSETNDPNVDSVGSVQEELTSCSGRACSTQAACCPSYVCTGGHCQLPCSAMRCTSTAECCTNYICASGRCQLHCAGEACGSRCCPLGESCYGGAKCCPNDGSCVPGCPC
jgi:hypothetical protein